MRESSFKKITDTHYTCNFGPGYGDMIQSLAICNYYARQYNSRVKLTYTTNLNLDLKVKEDDQETIRERFDYIYNNLKNNLVDVEFKESNESGCNLALWQIMDPEPHWWLDEMWQEPSNYVTVQLVEPALWKHEDNPLYNWRLVEDDVILNLASKFSVKIKVIDYQMKASEVHQLMLGSKLHIGYCGSTTNLAVATGTPTLLVSNNKEYASTMFDQGVYHYEGGNKLNDIYDHCLNTTKQKMEEFNV